MQYKCIYCLLDWRKTIHIVSDIRQHDWLSTKWQQFRREPDGHQTDRGTTSGCTPVQSESRTSWGRGSFLAACSQTAGPATACEARCASWRPSGSGWGPRCNWGPSAGFHTWTVSCPDPTGGPLCVSDQKLCSNPASSSSLWRWQPSAASWRSHISLGSWSPVPRTRIRSQCSWVDETSWCLVEESNRSVSSDQRDSAMIQQIQGRSFQFQLQGPSEVSSVSQPGWCPSPVSFVLK